MEMKHHVFHKGFGNMNLIVRLSLSRPDQNHGKDKGLL